MSDGSIRRLTAAQNAEYRPALVPDRKVIVYLGTKRRLTNLETMMEDTIADGRRWPQPPRADDDRP